MSFDVPADAYLRFMGRFSDPLAGRFVDVVGIRPGHRVLDVGCGPGVLTAHLVQRCGADAVAAIDPSASFVAAAAERLPGVDVRQGVAEHLPYDDHVYDAALAQLVVHFMSDPAAGLAEMGRVTRPGGVVAATVWNLADGGQGPLTLPWRAAREIDPAAPGEESLAGTGEGQLARIAEDAGLDDVHVSTITVAVPFGSFEEWWAPYQMGVGPIGDYIRAQDEDSVTAIRERCAELLPPAPFEQPATAWCVMAVP
jgi:SAM-dependent methyltransferase